MNIRNLVKGFLGLATFLALVLGFAPNVQAGHQGGGINFNVTEINGNGTANCYTIPTPNPIAAYRVGITYIDVADTTYIVSNVFHDPVAGCGATIHTNIGTMGTSIVYHGETGDHDFSWDTRTINCGRVQLDVGFSNADDTSIEQVVVGQVINYGVDCPTGSNPTGTIKLTSNVAPTWGTMTGPRYGFGSVSTPGQVITLENYPVGAYEVYGAPLSCYSLAYNNQVQNLTAGGEITFALVYTYTCGGTPPPPGQPPPPPNECTPPQTGTPPNCTTPPPQCTPPQTGTPPNCVTPSGPVGLYCDLNGDGLNWGHGCSVPTVNTPYFLGARADGWGVFQIQHLNNMVCNENSEPGSCGQPGVDMYYKYGPRTLAGDFGPEANTGHYTLRTGTSPDLPGGFGSGPTDAIDVVLAPPPPTTYSLTVLTGNGNGTVSGPGIECPGDCFETYPAGTIVPLFATDGPGFTFTNWTAGADFICGGQTRNCSDTMNANKFAQANFTPPPPAFNYSLSNSGNSVAVKGDANVFTQNTITKTLTAGAPEAVSLSLSGVPSGVSHSIANGTCAPNCNSTITFTVTPSANIGTYPITVTGSPLGRQTTFNLIISGSATTVTCTASPYPAHLGETVTWTAEVDGGTPPFTYRWSGTNIPTNPAPTGNPYKIAYKTIGVKIATVIVDDANDLQSTCSTGTGGPGGIPPGGTPPGGTPPGGTPPGGTPPPGTELIIFDPEFEEF